MINFLHGLEKSLLVFLLLAMTTVTFVQVVARYVFNSGVIWALELTVFLYAWLVLLGAAHLAREGRHIGIDALTGALSARGQKICGFIASGASVVYALMMLSGAWTYFAKFYQLNIPAAELPVPTWIVLIVLPLSFAVLVVRFGHTFWRILTGRDSSMLSSLEDQELVDELTAAQANQPATPSDGTK